MTRQLKISRAPDGGLMLERREQGKAHATPVRLTLCFPWTDPTRYVSLKDSQGKEQALIEDPEQSLDPESCQVIRAAIAEAGFVLEIQGIQHLEEECELRLWKVRTPHGLRTFQTKTDDWPRRVPGGGLLIRDVSGDLFHIPKPAALDPKSKSLLWAYID